MNVYTTLTTDKGEEYPVPVETVERLKADYGDYISVDLEFKKMKTWLDANPARRKTKRGMNRFITSWILRAVADHEKYETASKTPKKKERYESGSFDVDEFFALALKKSEKEMRKHRKDLAL